MHTNILTTVAALSDDDLLTRLQALAGKEREVSVELVAHLAVLDTRPVLYAADGYGSLFSYCKQALRLSEDAACNRIEAARACRRFPYILELLATGALSLTAVRLLGRHLTDENHRAVLARAENKRRWEIEALVAELAPRPDVRSVVRRLPSIRPQTMGDAEPSPDSTRAPAASPFPVAATAPPPRPAPRPIVEALAPERYRVQFTIGQETQEKLRRLQALLRREIRTATRALSSTEPSACSWRGSSGGSWARRCVRVRSGSSVPGRIATPPRARFLPATPRTP